jgi:hypothetical protein
MFLSSKIRSAVLRPSPAHGLSHEGSSQSLANAFGDKVELASHGQEKAPSQGTRSARSHQSLPTPPRPSFCSASQPSSLLQLLMPQFRSKHVQELQQPAVHGGAGHGPAEREHHHGARARLHRHRTWVPSRTSPCRRSRSRQSKV